MTLYEFVWICMILTLFDSVRLYITLYGFVSLLMTLHDSVWVCITLYDLVLYCMNLYESILRCLNLSDPLWLCISTYMRKDAHVRHCVWKLSSILNFFVSIIPLIWPFLGTVIYHTMGSFIQWNFHSCKKIDYECYKWI